MQTHFKARIRTGFDPQSRRHHPDGDGRPPTPAQKLARLLAQSYSRTPLLP